MDAQSYTGSSIYEYAVFGLELSAETFKKPQMRRKFLPVEMLEHGERHELVGVKFETILVEQSEFLGNSIRQSSVEGQY